MFDHVPENTIKAYERFIRKENYAKAYQCLQSLLRDFPSDEWLLQKIIDLCLVNLDHPDLARRWLKQIIKVRTSWVDYLLLSDIASARLDDKEALAYLAKTKKLISNLPSPLKAQAQEHFRKSQSLVQITQRLWRQNKNINTVSGADVSENPLENASLSQRSRLRKHQSSSVSQPHPVFQSVVDSSREIEKRHIPSHDLPIQFSPLAKSQVDALTRMPLSSLSEAQFAVDFQRLMMQGEYNELLCLNSMTGVEKYWFQIETVKKVLKHFHGRVLLCDEVGLGKTVEAGMLIKEYLTRHMARNVLILTPPAFISQWQEEMENKFGLKFLTMEDSGFAKDPQEFWKEKHIIASLNAAKSKRNFDHVIRQFYDILVIDEAHHLRNRATQSWELVNRVQKKFIFLLTATPVQNNLLELYNLITLLKPGQFKTEKVFKQEFMGKGHGHLPAQKEKLRSILREVMIRNTRSVIDLKLPKRFATTLRLDPSDSEKEIYQSLNQYLRENNVARMTANLLLREAGSSPFALQGTLLNLSSHEPLSKITALIERLDSEGPKFCKTQALLEILQKNPVEKKLIFTQFLKSMDYLMAVLIKEGIAFAIFRGSMTAAEKDLAIKQFRDDVPVLISMESGGEGRNIQFCNTIINFDLPWNPMRIEQRIGRIHRIGQTRDVFVFNLSVKDTLDDYIIDILDNKINMFQMVIGEIEPILGHLGKEDDFEDVIMQLWLQSSNDRELKNNFEKLGEDLISAKNDYLKQKAVDSTVFGDDYET